MVQHVVLYGSQRRERLSQITQAAWCVIRVSMGYRLIRISKVGRDTEINRINLPKVLSLLCAPLREISADF